ncbi:hypothetical protein ACFLS1_02865 [Verrucomicrobiota bacterium]
MNDRILKVLAVCAIVVFCLHAFSDNKADLDLWGNTGFVKAVPWSPEFHRTNTFSFTQSDHPWINHEWGAEYIFHLTHEYMGNTGLLALKIILGLCVILLIHLSMKIGCRSGRVRFLFLLLVISTMSYGFSTRPHHFTYVMYALFLFLLKSNRYKTLLVLAPLAGVLWANMHGAFFIGILLTGFYSVFELMKTRSFTGRARTASIISLILFFSSFFTPYGLRTWSFILESGSNMRPYLSEWAPFHPLKDFVDHTDFVALSVLSLLAVCCSRRKKDITWLGILIVSFACGLLMRRNIPLFAITACLVVPQHIEAVADEPLRKIFLRIPKPVLISFLSLFIAVSAWYTFNFNKTNPFEIEVQQDRHPSDIILFMQENGVAGNALVFFDWAEYCIWKLYPECRVFTDGRLWSAYSTDVIKDYFNFLYLGDNWSNALDNYPTDIVLIHTGNPVYEKMLCDNKWALVCESSIAGLFLKKSVHKEFLERMEAGGIVMPQRQQNVFFP